MISCAEIHSDPPMRPARPPTAFSVAVIPRLAPSSSVGCARSAAKEAEEAAGSAAAEEEADGTDEVEGEGEGEEKVEEGGAPGEEEEEKEE